MEIAVLNIAGEDTGKKVKLKKSIFGIEPNDHAIYLDVKQHQANKRQGTHKAKERSDITGSTRKIKRQKGTGTARAGSIKSPIFRGGGRTFGPRPRSYGFKLNKKVKQLAKASALSYKAKNKAISIVEDFNFEAPKTREYVDLLNKLKVMDKKSVMVLDAPNKNILVSSRNVKGAKVLTLSELNTFEILNAAQVIFNESSIKNLQKED
jgi:large subunit ribosomal protein L4